MYLRLRSGELTQGEAAQIYELGVIQVGRIARGESRAGATGARDDHIPNFNLLADPGAAQASEEAFVKRMAELAAKPKPSLYSDPPPTEEHRSEVLQQMQSDIAQHPVTRVNDELDGLLENGAEAPKETKGD
jgi:hypothetical protein